MGCSCAAGSDENSKKVNTLLDSVGIREVVEQGREAFSEVGRALERLSRAERAEVLGIGQGAVDLYFTAATQASRRARQQLRTVVERIDHIRESDEWAEHVRRVRIAFHEQDGRQLLHDARSEIIIHLDDRGPEINAAQARLTLAGFDRAIQSAADGDLDQVLDFMRQIMTSAILDVDSPEAWRAPFSADYAPIDAEAQAARSGGWCTALGACVIWADASLAIAIAICAAVPFCWCCFWWAAVLTWMAHTAACVLAFNNACNAGF